MMQEIKIIKEAVRQYQSGIISRRCFIRALREFDVPSNGISMLVKYADETEMNYLMKRLNNLLANGNQLC